MSLFQSTQKKQLVKRFVTIIPHIENLELRKDTGQIPYQLHKILGYDSTLVTYFYTLQGGRNAGAVPEPPKDEETINHNYPYLLTEVPGLKIHFLKNKGRAKFYERAIYEYLVSQSKNIDILNLFHFTSENIFYTFLYKFKNPKGKIYIKLDIDISFYESQKNIYNANVGMPLFKKLFWEKLIFPAFFKMVSLISGEHENGVIYFKNRFNCLSYKIKLLPNGVDEKLIINKTGAIKSFGEKENIILTVGRIGTQQKNNEMLLKALTNIQLKNWVIYFVGPIEQGFQTIINNFFLKHPHLTEKVFFTGLVNSKELYDYYNRAKIFCLTSLNEGFPLAASEAAFFGNYLILTDSIYAFNELTDKGRFGYAVQLNNEDDLAEKIQQLINNENVLEACYKGMRLYAKNKLTWQSIIPQLYKYLNGYQDV